MARADLCGMFWDERPPPKPPKKEKLKVVPPVRFWEQPDYLPGLEDAKVFVPDLFNDQELYQAAIHRERLVYDIEVYPNYCLFAFKSIQTGKVVYFELSYSKNLDIPKLQWILSNFLIVNFNGIKYDCPVTAVALGGHSPEALWAATEMIIVEQLRAGEVYKKFKVKKLELDQIDLIELTSLAPGLKVCAGRLHAKRLQDLPFKPGTILTADQILILRRYCINDLDNTILLYNSLIKQIELREQMGARFCIDLRSLSDAQMAEAIIASEVKKRTGRKHIAKTTLLPGTSYKYQTPAFISYQTPLMNQVLGIVQTADFKVDPVYGGVIMPPELRDLVIRMNKGSYNIGIGGLHSQEKSIAHVADDNYFIVDTDVTSYYPNMILNAGISPANLGHDFLLVYNGIVVERISAKVAGDIVVAECLKIVANGTFGKLGSPWSIMYAPNLMIQVTVTGQLSILMLAERFELAGIEVTSINTDGIVVKCLRSMEAVYYTIVKQWEKETGFNTEEVRYKATYSKDVNNYIAVYEKPQKGELFKLKGVYGKTSSKKNAVTEICVDAVKNFITTGAPIMDSLLACKDLTRFTAMRAVAGGAVKGDPVEEGKPVKSGIYLGKLVRWYYAKGEQGQIIYAKTGNKVALTDGAKPCMDLPDVFPDDVDYEKYEQLTLNMLFDIGFYEKEKDVAKV